jgi:hypothetical protein
MNREEIMGCLTANVDKVVRLTFSDGDIRTVKIHVVDDDGVVYFVFESDKVGEQAYWAIIGDIESVLPLENSK